MKAICLKNEKKNKVREKRMREREKERKREREILIWFDLIFWPDCYYTMAHLQRVKVHGQYYDAVELNVETAMIIHKFWSRLCVNKTEWINSKLSNTFQITKQEKIIKTQNKKVILIKNLKNTWANQS